MLMRGRAPGKAHTASGGEDQRAAAGDPGGALLRELSPGRALGAREARETGTRPSHLRLSLRLALLSGLPREMASARAHGCHSLLLLFSSHQRRKGHLHPEMPARLTAALGGQSPRFPPGWGASPRGARLAWGPVSEVPARLMASLRGQLPSRAAGVPPPRGWVWRGRNKAGLTGSVREETGRQRDHDLAFPVCNGLGGTEA
ncbi:unnamed protein product [Rangifer tarandus platyrhynchus]|uniref:Uncharacterized protein n=1 Tax=Rangifer tarandus platyrhynchus TaxID=3082113 RepID=A0AC59YTD6_RANTA